MTGSDEYFAANAGERATDKGAVVKWDEVDPIEIVSGLRFQPVLGNRLMVNFVRFEPHTEAPEHWHEEEQVSFVLDGELEFELAGEKQIVRKGQAVVIPPNVPHAARTHGGSCLEVDVFCPPRRGLLKAMGIPRPDAG